jgi:hypothetical protein
MQLEPLEPKFKPPKVPMKKKRKSSIAPVVPVKKASPVKPKESALSRDWSSLLNSRTMSDVVVYVKEERELRAHKLVLFVRCPTLVKVVYFIISIYYLSFKF